MKRPYGRPVAYTWCTYCFFANKPVNNRPHAPHPPCNCAASSGSSYLHFSASLLHPVKTQDATKPQMIAAHGSTTAQPEVMAAKPPSNPLQTSITFQWPTSSLLLNKVVSAAVHPASVVVIAVLPTALH
ncbi:hypothetical protein HanXRQr2_Chr06g0274441 [Helianthus annuus]|uniref:Uncharacterized protein n=1 Tax=Helianthus annuus TaxID=4232 RepID=A0A9K3NK92_HELAN|nr:hypothetical protein HanXRQr2_Chr06g0274441 [Helianthus annuus]KAJ0916733.1 hypothetical protein HanPSC8_Chr06g0265241 [Helianthus annuus]